MARRPLQYILFVLGIALGVAMMVSIDLANGSASRAFALSTDAIVGKTTHRIVGGPTGVDETIYRQLRTELGYTRSAPVVQGAVAAVALGEQPYQLLGIDPFAEPPFRSYLGGDVGSTAGLTQFIAQKNAVLLPADTAADNDLALGDTFTLTVGGVAHDVQIVGLIEPTDDLTRRGIAGLLFADIATAQEIFGRAGTLSHIDLIVEDDATIDQIAALLPTGTEIETAAAEANAIQQMTAAFELNLTALSLLALVVGMFLIYNTVTFSVVQRRPLFGVLRCLGVTGRQLAALILSEALVLGLVGSIIGVGVGVFLGNLMVGLVTQTINDLYFTVTVREVTVPTISLVKGLVIGIGSAVLASAIPAIEAMRTAPSTAMRRSNLESRVNTILPWLVVAWAVLCAAGVLLLWLDAGLVIAFAGLFAILFAFALITAPITVWLMNAMAKLPTENPLYRLAPRDIVRSLSRTSVAIAALMVAVSVIVGVSIMIGSFRNTVVQWLDQTLVADIFISPPGVSANSVDGTIDRALLAQMSAWEGVDYPVTARSTTLDAPLLNATLNTAAIAGDVSRGNRTWLWQSDDVPTMWAQFDEGAGVFITEPLLRRFDMPLPPQPITVQSPDGLLELPVLGVVYDFGSDQGLMYIAAALYTETWNDPAISSVGLFVTPDADIDQMVSDMQAAFAPVQQLDVRSNQALRNTSIEIFDRTFAITDALRLLATVVAFIGVLSALMSLQLERGRELGTLRATGMTRGQLWQLTLLETGLMGGIAGLIAMPTGYVLAWILIYVINIRSFGWSLDMQLQPSSFLYAFGVAVVAALLAGIYPAWRLGRMVIAAALRSD